MCFVYNMSIEHLRREKASLHELLLFLKTHDEWYNAGEGKREGTCARSNLNRLSVLVPRNFEK